MTFDFDELMRICAVVKRDGDAALTDEDRGVYEAWREVVQGIADDPRDIATIVDIFDRLPAEVTRPIQHWTLAQVASFGPLLREELVHGGVDVEVAERRRRVEIHPPPEDHNDLQ
jgi:hypothetical protein